MGVGGDNSSELRGQPPEHAVNPEVFHQHLAQPAGNDRVAESKIGQVNDAGLDYARQTCTEVANNYILRTGQLTPAELKVMAGVLDLGLRTNAWTPENFQQIQVCLEERAGQQNNAPAANALRGLAKTFETLHQKGTAA